MSSEQFATLYNRDNNGNIRFWTIWTEGGTVNTKYGIKDTPSSYQTSSFDVEVKNVGKANETSLSEQAILEAESMWKKQIRKGYYKSVEEIPEITLLPMLAHKLLENIDRLEFPASIQPKLDGMRCNIYRKDDKIVSMSRGGKTLPLTIIPTALSRYLSNNPTAFIDGELYDADASFEANMSTIKGSKGDDSKRIYNIYDVAYTDEPEMEWTVRNECLNRMRETIHHSNIKFVDTYIVNSMDDIERYHKLFVSQGYEGSIIRLHNYKYEFDNRSHGLLKNKDFIDEEFKITGVTTGKGKFKGLAIFECETVDHQQFNVTPIGTNAERKEMYDNSKFYIGKMLKVKFQEYTKYGIPRFPTGLGIRKDK